jgi:hypothetical protein
MLLVGISLRDQKRARIHEVAPTAANDGRLLTERSDVGSAAAPTQPNVEL